MPSSMVANSPMEPLEMHPLDTKTEFLILFHLNLKSDPQATY